MLFAWLKSFLSQRRRRLRRVTAGEREATVVFIDIVAFSKVSEEFPDALVFKHLQAFLGHTSQLVTQYGGWVDKTFGDGMLAVFDDSSADGRENTNQANQALRCALQIQSENFVRILEADAQHVPIFPLRIGINTDQIVFGSLDAGTANTTTIFGHGVNFAKRLEEACEINSIMIGPLTATKLDALGKWPSTMRRRLIQVKHESDFQQVFECDPLDRRSRRQSKALEDFRRITGLIRHSPRIQPESDLGIEIETDFGPSSLLNVSQGGLGLTLPVLLARGTKIRIRIDINSPHESVRRQFASLLKNGLELEVRWSMSDGEEHLHGLAFRSNSANDGALMFAELTHLTGGTIVGATQRQAS